MNSALSATATNWREGRRLRAWELHEQGWRQSEIAAALGVTSGAVCQWMRRVRDGGGPEALRRRKAPGGRPRLSTAQQSQVLGWLREGAAAHGFRGDLWTRKRVAGLIERIWASAIIPATGASCCGAGSGAHKGLNSARANATRRQLNSG